MGDRGRVSISPGCRTRVSSEPGPCHGPCPCGHPLCPVPAQSKARGAFGGATLELTLPLTGKVGLIINDLFLIGLLCPLQPCSGIFGTKVPGNNKPIGTRMSSLPST